MSSAVGYGPLWRIDGPPPQSPVYTLIGASRVVDDIDEQQIARWINGAAVYPYPSGQAHVWDPCSVGSDRVKADAEVVDLPEYGAMVIYLPETCQSFSIFGANLSADQAQSRFTSRAVAAMSAVESAAVEREFLAGDVFGLNPHLADGNGTFPNVDTPTSIVHALMLLELEIAASGKRGMIHLSPAALIAASANHLVVTDTRANVLTTATGTILVPGAGYAEGVTPSGGHADAGDNEEWIFASGLTEVRRSEVFVTPEQLSQALNRETNEVTYYAERYYLVDWDTEVQSAVLVDRCTSECGSPS